MRCRKIVDYQFNCVIEPLERRVFLSAGDLDTSFSGNGKATVDFGEGVFDLSARARDVAVQRDGKTVVVGGTSDGRFAIARFNVDGTLDATFGPNLNGKILTAFGPRNSDSVATAVLIEPDGKILVVGDNVWFDPEAGNDYSVAMARYLPNGTLDDSFAGDGKLKSDLDVGDELATFNSVDAALQLDGKIIVATSRLTSSVIPGVGGNNYDFVVARFQSNGSLDDSFGDDGKRPVGFGDDEFAHAVSIDYNGTKVTNPHYGTIVVVGHRDPDVEFGKPEPDSYAVARLRPNGSFDRSFSGDGRVITAFPGSENAIAYGVLIQPGGKIVAAGTAFSDDPGSYQFAMARYTDIGELDSTFGADETGLVTTGFGGKDRGNDIIEGYNDRLIVGGAADGQFAIAVYTRDGRLDENFGANGKVTTAFDENSGVPKLAQGPGNRRFVAAGGAKFHTARYLDVGANAVAISSLDPNAFEGNGNTASFFVTRRERLPTPVRVFYTVGGTATQPGDFTGLNIQDPVINPGFNSSALEVQPAGGFPRPPIDDRPKIGSVEIPANQTFAVVTVTPVNDALVEGNETVIVTLNDTSTYDLDVPSSATLNVIDDESTTLSPIADALVKQGTHADVNFGSARTLQARNQPDANRRSYLKFDLSSVDLGTINSVKLRLFGDLSDASQTNIISNVFSVSDTTWDESAITFSNKPGNGSPALASATLLTGNSRWYEWDVTDYIKAEKLAGRDVISLVVRNATTSASFASFNSRESELTPPQLVVLHYSP